MPTQTSNTTHNEWSTASYYAKWLAMKNFIVKIHIIAPDSYTIEAEKRNADLRIMTNGDTLDKAMLEAYLTARAVV